jgi:hypothetical protein
VVQTGGGVAVKAAQFQLQQSNSHNNLLLQQHSAFLCNNAATGIGGASVPQGQGNSQYAANIRNNRLCQKYLMNAAAAAAAVAAPNYYESFGMNHNHNPMNNIHSPLLK